MQLRKNKKPLHSERNKKHPIRYCQIIFVCSICNGFRQVHALFKIIFSCMNNMFSANTIMGKFCHLCLEHDYNIIFSSCQAHLSSWQVGAVFCFPSFEFEPTQHIKRGTLENRQSKPLWVRINYADEDTFSRRRFSLLTAYQFLILSWIINIFVV